MYMHVYDSPVICLDKIDSCLGKFEGGANTDKDKYNHSLLATYTDRHIMHNHDAGTLFKIIVPAE